MDSHPPTRWAETVVERYPDLKHNVSGYNLNRLVDEAHRVDGGDGAEDVTATDEVTITDDATVNLARLLAGSEGTLAVVTTATVSLEPVPETKSVALLTYESVVDAVTDVQHVLDHDPAAIDIIDDTLIDLASDTAEFAAVTAMPPEQTRAALLVEFYAEDDNYGREQVSTLLADRVKGVWWTMEG